MVHIMNHGFSDEEFCRWACQGHSKNKTCFSLLKNWCLTALLPNRWIESMWSCWNLDFCWDCKDVSLIKISQRFRLFTLMYGRCKWNINRHDLTNERTVYSHVIHINTLLVFSKKELRHCTDLSLAFLNKGQIYRSENTLSVWVSYGFSQRKPRHTKL